MMAEIMIDIYFKLHYFTLLLLLDFQSKILVKYLIIYEQESQLDIRTSLWLWELHTRTTLTFNVERLTNVFPSLTRISCNFWAILFAGGKFLVHLLVSGNSSSSLVLLVILFVPLNNQKKIILLSSWKKKNSDYLPIFHSC